MKKIISIALSMVLLVAISIPVISISVNLGEKGASRTWVSVPTTTSYYELYGSSGIFGNHSNSNWFETNVI